MADMSWATSISPISSFDKMNYIVTGWYEEEKTLYGAAEIAWDRLQSIGGPYKNPYDKKTNLDGLDFIDDYFRWNVISFWWYLWTDGTWHKENTKLINKTYIKMNEFFAYDLAARVLSKSIIPKEFIDYDKHLQSAHLPYNILWNSESIHSI